MARYVLRYTNDLKPIRESDNADELKTTSDYLLHIWDRTANRVVWQNGPSRRYGTSGVSFIG